jgi:hypothetical protein
MLLPEYLKAVDELVKTLSAWRKVWYAKCVDDLEKDFAKFDAPIRIKNKNLDGRADFVVRVYLSIVVVNFIRKHALVSPTIEYDLCMMLYERIADCSDTKVRDEMRDRLVRSLNSNETYLWGLFRALGEHGIECENSLLPPFVFMGDTPMLSLYTEMFTARGFADSTLRKQIEDYIGELRKIPRKNRLRELLEKFPPPQ